MITCQECLERCYPSNPRVDGGCEYYCDKPSSYRELETQSPPEQVLVHRHSDMSRQDWDLLQQTALKVGHLQKKLTEHTEYKRKSPVKSGKNRGIKIE